MEKSGRNDLSIQCRQLWETVFGDSEEFVDLYFNRRFTPENTICVFESGRVVSAMQSLQYDMTFCQAVIRVGYVSGLATLPGFRNRGLAAKVLRESHRRLYDRGALLSLLIPAENSLFDYYRRMNYAVCSYFSEEQVMCSGHLNADKSKTYMPAPCLTQNLIEFVQRQMQKRPCCIQHAKNDIEDIFRVMELGHGGFPLILDKDGIVAVAVTELVDGVLRVNDILGIEKYRNCLLNHIAMAEKTTAMLVRDYEKQSKPYGMARIINAKKIIEMIAKANPDMDFTLSVVDDEIVENNGTYSIKNGFCQHAALNTAYCQALSISELTEKLLSRFNPVMSLMLD